ncbi:MAG: hypothetical protein M3Z57_02735 [Candidatus Dormibacteraeota bacterium]|nr:hypothetical protein [Candidatus Dormibacteraeota bacterium]
MTEQTGPGVTEEPVITEERQPVPSDPDEGYDQDADVEREQEGPTRSADVP